MRGRDTGVGVLMTIAVVALAGASAPEAAGNASHHRIPPRKTKVTISAAAATPSVILGTTDAISGTVSPAVPHLKLALQEQAGKTWTTWASRRVSSSGSFVFKAKPRRHGASVWRIAVPTRSRLATGVSPHVNIRALSWFYLAKLQEVRDDAASGTGQWSTGPAESNGVNYSHPVDMEAGCNNSDGGDYWVDFNLARRYTQFTATVGLRDDAPTNYPVSFKLIADGQTLASGTLTLGKATPIAVSVSNVLRLRLFINDPQSTTLEDDCGTGIYEPATVVWGNASVLG
jgi:hypothetical protein